MSSQKIFLPGGGGHCKAVIDVLESNDTYEINGVFDVKSNIGKKICGYPIIGTDDELLSKASAIDHFLVTAGHIKTASIRKKLFSLLLEEKLNIPVVIDGSGKVSKHSKIGLGTIAMRNVVINADAKIGVNCILNTGSIVEHDAVIGNHTHVSTGAIVNGGAKVGEECFIGSNATVAQGVTLGNNVIIAAGSTVLGDVESNVLYAGSPAKFKKNI